MNRIDSMTNPARHDSPQIVKHWTESEPVRLADHRAGRVYLAGPMTGLPEFNFPAFNAEAAILRAQGLTVINPAEHGIVEGAEWADYLRHDIAGLASCERIHLLRGWENSKGARLEVHIAQQLGMVITRQALATLQAQPAAEVSDAEIERAAQILANDRGYGWPHIPESWKEEFRETARAILALRPQAVPMTEDQFAQLLRKLKRSREVFQAGRDSYETACAPMNSDDEAWFAYLAHHGITAPAGGEG